MTPLQRVIPIAVVDDGRAGRLAAGRAVDSGGLRLLAAFVHELSQPLGAILADAECAHRILADGRDVPGTDVAAAIEAVCVQARGAGEILRALRELYLNDVLPMAATDVNASATHVVDSMVGRTTLVGLEVRRELQEGLPRVLAHPILLELAIRNVVENAMHAVRRLPEGPRRVVVTTEAGEEGVAVTVRDNGPGLPEPVLSRIRRGVVESTHDGLGLGLWLTQCIVDRHGGSLEVRGRPEGGATAAIVLPVAGQQR